MDVQIYSILVFNTLLNRNIFLYFMLSWRYIEVILLFVVCKLVLNANDVP